MITKDQVLKALESLESKLGEDETTVVKASEQNLDQPEGADLGNPAKEKMSDLSKKDEKAKKSEPEEEREEKKAEVEEEDEEHKEKASMPAHKSFSEELPEEVQTKIDVSDFLKSLVDHTGETIDFLREQIVKSELSHEARYGELSEVVSDVVKSQAKIGVVLKAICERIGVIENSPARAPKAETVAKSDAKPAEREFASGLADGEEKMFKSLSDNPIIAKSQIAEAMCDLVKKGEATDLDVIGFESSGHIRPEIVSKMKSILN